MSRLDKPAVLVLGNLGSMGLGLLSAPIIARSVGPEGRGITAAAIAAFAILPIVLAAGVPLEVRRRASLEQGDTALRAMRLLAVAAAVPSIAAATVLHFTLFADVADPARSLIFIGLALSPISVAWIADTNFLVATEQYLAVALLRLCPPAILVGTIVVTTVLDTTSVATVVGASVAGSLCNFLLGLALTRVSILGPRSGLGSLLHAGLRFSGSSIAEAASYRLDQLLALPLLGASQAGLYSVAGTLAVLPVAFAQVVAASYFREIAIADDQLRDEMRRVAVRSASTTGWATSLGLAAATPFLVPFLFGPDFSEAVTPSLIALVGAWAVVVSFVATMVLTAEGRGRQMTISQFVGLGAGIVALLTIGPPLGATGAAVAATFGSCVLLAIQLRFVRVSPKWLVPTVASTKDAFRRLSW